MDTGSTKPYDGPWFSYASPSEIIAASTVLPVLGIIVVGLRFQSRVQNKVKIGIDDWLIVPGLILLLGVAICLLIGVSNHQFGYSTPLSALTANYSLIDQLTYFLQLFMIASYGFIKLSVIFFYRRLFVVNYRSAFNYLTWAAVVITIIWTISFLFSFIFTCGTHISAYWGSLESEEKYCGQGGFTLENAFYISDFITDVLILCLPIPMVWNLKTTIRRKLAVIGIFMLGGMALAASIARMAMYVEVANRAFSDVGSTEDRDLTESTILYWSIIECSLALIAACLPTIRIIFINISVASVIRSVRSAISLRSLGSQHTQRSETAPHASAGTYLELGDQRSNSNIPFAHNDKQYGFESSVTHGDDIPEVSKPGKIHVKDSFAMDDARV